MALGRPRRNPSQAATEFVAFRLTKDELRALDGFVELKNQELAALGSSMTRASFLRALVTRNIQPQPKPAKRKPAPAPEPEPEPEEEAPEPDTSDIFENSPL